MTLFVLSALLLVGGALIVGAGATGVLAIAMRGRNSAAGLAPALHSPNSGARTSGPAWGDALKSREEFISRSRAEGIVVAAALAAVAAGFDAQDSEDTNTVAKKA